MSRTVYYCAASLDGYIAERDDTIDWLTSYQGSFDGGEELALGPLAPGGSYERFYAGVGALVSGSTTYEFILDHVAGGGSWPYSGRPYWVLSSRQLPLPAAAAGDVHVQNAPVVKIADDLRAAAGDGDVWVVGGGNVASQFAEAGLLDELHLTIVPVVLGAGKPLFNRRLSGSPLQLLGSELYANGMVELRYRLSG
jgi:dihydrofolate reductase